MSTNYKTKKIAQGLIKNVPDSSVQKLGIGEYVIYVPDEFVPGIRNSLIGLREAGKRIYVKSNKEEEFHGDVDWPQPGDEEFHKDEEKLDFNFMDALKEM